MNVVSNLNSALDANNITISEGTLVASGGISGSDVKINGGTVAVEGDNQTIAIYSNSLTITGGTVYAVENGNPNDRDDWSDYIGIYGYEGVTITGGDVFAIWRYS